MRRGGFAAALVVSALVHVGLGLMLLFAARAAPPDTREAPGPGAGATRVRLLAPGGASARESPPARSPRPRPEQPKPFRPSGVEGGPSTSLRSTRSERNLGQGEIPLSPSGAEGSPSTSLGSARSERNLGQGEIPLSPSGVEGSPSTSLGSARGEPVPSPPPGASLGELHQKLSQSALRCYPPAARRFRLEGTVNVSFCLDEAGALASLALNGTTGSPVLDRAAEACVVQGALPLPVSAGCYAVPVRFGRAE